MEQIILVVHLLVALAIIGLIMMQQGKGSDIGASFGGGASQTLFGSTGSANVLTKSTAWLVAAFFATSFGLAVIADSRTADEDDLGFELPVESVEQAPVQSDIPSAGSMDVTAEPQGELPVVEPVEAGDELPEG